MYTTSMLRDLFTGLSSSSSRTGHEKHRCACHLCKEFMPHIPTRPHPTSTSPIASSPSCYSLSRHKSFSPFPCSLPHQVMEEVLTSSHQIHHILVEFRRRTSEGRRRRAPPPPQPLLSRRRLRRRSSPSFSFIFPSAQG